jgi:hypothetical protein
MKIEKHWHQPDAMPNCGRHGPLRAVSIARPPFQAAIAGPVLRAAAADLDRLTS